MPRTGYFLAGITLALVSVPGAAIDSPPMPAALAGDYLKVESRQIGRPFHVYIRHPENYDPRGRTRYPIVYLLDGDSLYPALAPTQLFTEIDDGIDEAIVVGIAYGSFAAPVNMRRTDFDTGAAAFAKFLADELIPSVESRVRADPNRRILFGQSRGGTYVLFDAFTQPDLFWARIASNPTLDHPRLDQQPTPARRRDLSIYVSSGEQDDPVLRGRAVATFNRWKARRDWPWKLVTVTMPSGTHAADVGRVYRWAMRQLLPGKPKP